MMKSLRPALAYDDKTRRLKGGELLAATGDPIDIDFRVDGNRWSMPYDQVRRSSFVESFATNPEFTVLSNGGTVWFDLDAIRRYW